jgi:hypothetical protein
MRTSRLEADPTPRSADIIAWRRNRLVASGFAPDVAAKLAGSRDIDLHAVLQLVDRGCPPRLAARILAPLDGSTTQRCLQ